MLLQNLKVFGTILQFVIFFALLTVKIPVKGWLMTKFVKSSLNWQMFVEKGQI